MLMQLFSLSGFGVNSPHDDTWSTAGISCGTNMMAPVGKSISIVHTGLMKIQPLLMQEGPEHWEKHFSVLSGSVPNQYQIFGDVELNSSKNQLLPPQSSPPMAHRVAGFVGLHIRETEAGTLHKHTHVSVLC